MSAEIFTHYLGLYDLSENGMSHEQNEQTYTKGRIIRH
jgi:hypothetical protein